MDNFKGGRKPNPVSSRGPGSNPPVQDLTKFGGLYRVMGVLTSFISSSLTQHQVMQVTSVKINGGVLPFSSSFSCQELPARPVLPAPRCMANNFKYMYGEFRSLRQRHLGRGPRAFPRTPRARDLWYYALVPWIYIHETI